jgi:hypothetical protein
MGERTTAHIWWSIYVKASDLRKLRQVHLPPIELALEGIEFDWQILKEKESPGLFRLINYQNFEIERVEDIVIPLLRRAYKLAPSWSISGLDDLATGRLQHIIGSCEPSSNQPPALHSIVFEVEPGRIGPMTRDGGWPLLDEPAEPEKLKPGQIRRPKPPVD